MSMRLWSSRLLYTAVLVFIAGLLYAQPSAYMKSLSTAYLKSLPKDTVKVTDGRTKDKRLHIKYKGVNRIIPTMSIAQFAGNMGLVSLGAGWDHGARGQWETALLAGFLPREEGRKRYITATLKETYTPWSIQVSDRFSFEPLTCGLYFNSILSRDFWVKEPDHYPSSYYGFSTKIRANVFIGASFTFYPSRRSKVQTGKAPGSNVVGGNALDGYGNALGDNVLGGYGNALGGNALDGYGNAPGGYGNALGDNAPGGYGNALGDNALDDNTLGSKAQYGKAPGGCLLRYVSLFYEFGTADMYIISKATNKYLKFWDIFGVSFGVKVKLI